MAGTVTPIAGIQALKYVIPQDGFENASRLPGCQPRLKMPLADRLYVGKSCAANNPDHTLEGFCFKKTSSHNQCELIEGRKSNPGGKNMTTGCICRHLQRGPAMSGFCTGPAKTIPSRKRERMRSVVWTEGRRDGFSSDAPHRPVGHARGRMASLADAVVFVLSAEDAAAGRVAMLVGTAAAKSSSGCRCQPETCRENNNSKQSSRKCLHENLHVSRAIVINGRLL